MSKASKTSAEQRESERYRIRQAMLDLCSEDGYAAVTEEILLQRAEVDLRTFRRHYSDLEDCFYDVLKVAVDRFLRQSERARWGLTAWRDRVRATAYALYCFLQEDERERRLGLLEARAASERAQVYFGRAIEDLFDLIDEGRREPGAPDSLTRATAEDVGGGIFNLMYTMTASGSPMPPEDQIVPQLMHMVVLPYLGPEAAAEELGIPPPPRSSTSEGGT